MNNSSVTFVTGCAISQSNFYITSNLDNLDTWDLFSKTFIYKYQSDDCKRPLNTPYEFIL